MSFQEKSTWVMTSIMVVVYGWYVIAVFGGVSGLDVAEVDYQSQMLIAVVLLVVFAVATHIVIAAASPTEAGTNDERDKEVTRFGGYVGGYVLGIGTLITLGLALLEVEYFWIANALLASLVASEVVSGGTRIVVYRRGF